MDEDIYSEQISVLKAAILCFCTVISQQVRKGTEKSHPKQQKSASKPRPET
jgi:hypothetical protein